MALYLTTTEDSISIPAKTPIRFSMVLQSSTVIPVIPPAVAVESAV